MSIYLKSYWYNIGLTWLIFIWFCIHIQPKCVFPSGRGITSLSDMVTVRTALNMFFLINTETQKVLILLQIHNCPLKP